MKKRLSYRDKLIELAYIYNVREIQDYVKSKKKDKLYAYRYCFFLFLFASGIDAALADVQKLHMVQIN